MRASRIAIVFIAAYALSAWAATPKVYKCGNTYSQTPCTEAVQVDTDDARSAAQKKDSDKATSRDMQAAKSMEKDRLADETKAQASGKETAKVIEKISAAQALKADKPAKDEVHKGELPKKKTATNAADAAADASKK